MKLFSLFSLILLIEMSLSASSIQNNLQDQKINIEQVMRSKRHFKHCKHKSDIQETFEFLTPDNCFFLFSDNYQSGLMNLVKNIPLNEFENAIHAYIDIANYYHIPSIVTASAEGSPNGPLVTDEYTNLFCSNIFQFFTRTGPINIMDYPPARQAIEKLKREGRTKVVINGIATDVCVVFPALTLLNEGFDVFVTTDASGTSSQLTQDTSLALLNQQGVKLTSWFMVACWLQRNWLDPALNGEYASPSNPTGAFEPLLTIVRKHYPEYNMLTWSKFGTPLQPIPNPCTSSP